MRIWITITILLVSWTRISFVHSFPRARRRIDEPAWNTLDGQPSVLFAHRGEKTLLPEHTLPGYETASILGADYVEPDLCMTKDDVFVCHHDLTLKAGTDVEDHPEFEHLKRNNSDGTFDWYIRDFTIAELKKLRIRQEDTGIRPQDYNSFFTIPTFQEYLNVIHRMTYTLNKTIGIVPELKEPGIHNMNRSANFMEKQMLELLSANGYPINEVSGGSCTALVRHGRKNTVVPINCPPTIIQCFQIEALEYLKGQSEIDLLLLVEEETTLLTYEGIRRAATVAKYYAVWKEYLYVGVEKDLIYNNKTWDKEVIANMGGFIPATEFTKIAHELGLRLVIYTIHDSREPSTRGCAIVPGCEPENKPAELAYFFNMGVDGIFIENVAESYDILQNYQCGAEERAREMAKRHAEENENNNDNDNDQENEINVQNLETIKVDKYPGNGASSAKSKSNVVSVITCMITGYFCSDEGKNERNLTNGT